jgi:hypothetical protein
MAKTRLDLTLLYADGIHDTLCRSTGLGLIALARASRRERTLPAEHCVR